MNKPLKTPLPVAGSQVLIPLDRLKKSPESVRKTPQSEAAMEAYAAGIAAKGILQNLVVKPEIEDDTPTGFYLVTIGEGRKLAQLRRAERFGISAHSVKERLRLFCSGSENPIAPTHWILVHFAV